MTRRPLQAGALVAASLLCHLPQVADAQATPPGPMTWTYGYDAEGNPKTITNPNGGVTQHTYDTLNRRRTTTQPLPAPGVPRPVILMDYDGRDQLARVQDPRNLATVYDTDGLGRVLSIQSPDSGLTTFTYDAGNEPITSTDARGITHRMTYGPRNRLERIDYPTGTPTVYEFGDNNGPLYSRARLARITDESGNTSYRYNAKGRILQKTQVVNSAAGSRSFTVATEWGQRGPSTGDPVRIIYPSGTSIEIGYEYAGRPGSITVTRNGQASILLSVVTYNAVHALKGWTWGDGTTYRRSFDSFLRLSSYPLGNSEGTGAAMGLTRTLSYDNAGNITGYLHTGQPGFDQTHRYDGLDRLVETHKTSTRYGYQYDATGNRRVREIGSDSYIHTVEDTSNRLVSVQEPSGNGGAVTRTYQYGPIGNLVSDGINTFVYSDRGRMSRADTPNGSVSYLVNGLEQRVSKTGLTVPGGAAYYVYTEEGGLLGEYDANGNALYEVIYLRGTPVGVITPTGLYYVYADHIDTPRVIARNTDHAIVWRWDEAEAFGATPPNEDPNGFGTFTFSMRFPGQVYDRETGLFYNINRDYQPSDGRYVQADPIGFEGGSLSLYTYVGGNPVRLIDPQGLEPQGAVDFIKSVFPNSRIPLHPPAECPDDCPDPVTITFTGPYACNPGDIGCFQAMTSSAQPLPIFATTYTLTYSKDCLLKLGVGFAGGKFAAGTVLINKAPAIATRIGFGATNVARVGRAAGALNSPPAAIVGVSVAVIGVLKECECHSK